MIRRQNTRSCFTLNYLVLSKFGRMVTVASSLEEPINHPNVICQKKFPFRTVPSLTMSVNSTLWYMSLGVLTRRKANIRYSVKNTRGTEIYCGFLANKITPGKSESNGLLEVHFKRQRKSEENKTYLYL
jgi:hypothetical protein